MAPDIQKFLIQGSSLIAYAGMHVNTFAHTSFLDHFFMMLKFLLLFEIQFLLVYLAKNSDNCVHRINFKIDTYHHKIAFKHATFMPKIL
jgi:hypothetical protein